MDGLPPLMPRVIDMPIEGGVFPHGMGDCVMKVKEDEVPLAPEKFTVTLDQQSREEIGFEARAISLDENDNLRPITEEMLSQAVNAQIHEYAAARKILREDHERIKELETALEHYVDMVTLAVPEDWDYPGMGGPPDMEQLEKRDVGEVARTALGI